MSVMKKYYYDPFKQKKKLNYKSSSSYLYQKFLSIDKRMRRNIVIGVSLFTIVIVTGFVLAMISLVQFGGSLIDEALGEGREEMLKSFPESKLKESVEKGLLHVDKTLFKKED